MAERSRIAMKQKDNTYKSISCFHNGSLARNGRMLYDNYQDPIKVEILMSLGDLSVLNEYLYPGVFSDHSFDKPLCDVCVAYHRDRGERLNYEVNEDLKSLIKNTCLSDEEYLYLYEDGRWKYAETSSQDYSNVELKDLENDLIKYNIIDKPELSKNYYIDELSYALAQYVKVVAPLDYANVDLAVEDMKKKLSTTSGVNNLLEGLCNDINYYVKQNDLSNEYIFETFKLATDLLVSINRYSTVMERQLDN